MVNLTGISTVLVTGISMVHMTSSRTAALAEHRARCKEAVHPSMGPQHREDNSLGLLANSQVTRGEGDSEEDWVSLINPHISQEERDELLSDDSQSEVDQEDRYQGEVSDEAQSFLDLAFKKAASNNQHKKWLENFPRPTSLSANPPTIDKLMYSLIQSSPGPTKKKILSHDRILVKLQRYASDATGPLTFLLSELQAGRPVPANKSLYKQPCVVWGMF